MNTDDWYTHRASENLKMATRLVAIAQDLEHAALSVHRLLVEQEHPATGTRQGMLLKAANTAHQQLLQLLPGGYRRRSARPQHIKSDRDRLAETHAVVQDLATNIRAYLA